MSRPCRLFLFDLDGTLADTREDIVRAVNVTLMAMNSPVCSPAEIIRYVGDGMEPLIQRVLLRVNGVEPDPRQVRRGVKLLLEEYRTHLIGTTTLYPGVRETLHAIRGAALGLISNKPEELCRRMLDQFELAGLFSVVLGGDSLPQRKPDPAPVSYAVSRCSVTTAETVMIGDSPGDILAGTAAGVATCGVTYGFRGREELEAAGSDVIIDCLTELPRYFSSPGSEGSAIGSAI